MIIAQQVTFWRIGVMHSCSASYGLAQPNLARGTLLLLVPFVSKVPSVFGVEFFAYQLAKSENHQETKLCMIILRKTKDIAKSFIPSVTTQSKLNQFQ